MIWFAGMFYLPRLFAYHAMADDAVGIERLKIMGRKFYLGNHDSWRCADRRVRVLDVDCELATLCTANMCLSEVKSGGTAVRPPCLVWSSVAMFQKRRQPAQPYVVALL